MIELLVVIAIIALVAGMSIPHLFTPGSSSSLKGNLLTVAGLLELARETAVSRNTYAYFCITSPAALGSIPASEQPVICVAVFASTGGADVLATAAIATDRGTPPDLQLVDRIRVLHFLDMSDPLPASSSLATSLDPLHSSSAGPSTAWTIATSTRFDGHSPTFDEVVKFTPSGAARVGSVPVETIDLVLMPARGRLPLAPTADDRAQASVIRINGLTGKITLHQP